MVELISTVSLAELKRQVLTLCTASELLFACAQKEAKNALSHLLAREATTIFVVLLPCALNSLTLKQHRALLSANDCQEYRTRHLPECFSFFCACLSERQRVTGASIFWVLFVATSIRLERIDATAPKG